MKEIHLQYQKETGIRMHDKIRDIKYNHNEVYDYITWLENECEKLLHLFQDSNFHRVDTQCKIKNLKEDIILDINDLLSDDY